MRKKIVAFAAALVIVFVFSSCSPQENEMIDYVNQTRSANHVRTLPINIDLYLKAQAWARRLANDQYLHHSPDLGSGNGYNWSRLGENVGRGGSIAVIEYMFMNSPSHRENILGSYWTSMGIGIVQDASGTYWVVQEFMQEVGQ